MIKNILYSLFLHFLVIFLIYINFHSRIFPENKSEEISISLIVISDDKAPKKKKSVKKVSENKKELKKPITPLEKDAPKKKQLKKTTKSKDIKTITKAKKTKIVKKSKPVNKKKKIIKPKNIPTTNSDNNSQPKEGVKKKSDDKQNTSDKPDNEPSNLENLNLSAREKLNIQNQLKRCYNQAVAGTTLGIDIMISIRVKIDKDGYINSDLDKIINVDRYNDPDDLNYKSAIDNARRTINLCSPLRNLPLSKYDIWKEVTLDFGKIN